MVAIFSVIRPAVASQPCLLHNSVPDFGDFGTEIQNMALQRVSCCCLLLASFLSPLLALEQPETVEDATCSAEYCSDPVTCQENWRTGRDEEKGGGALPSVHGRKPQRLSVVDSSDVHVSVKTAAKYHDDRLSLLLLTWFQTLQPQQVRLDTPLSHHCWFIAIAVTIAGSVYY